MTAPDDRPSRIVACVTQAARVLWILLAACLCVVIILVAVLPVLLILPLFAIVLFLGVLAFCVGVPLLFYPPLEVNFLGVWDILVALALIWIGFGAWKRQHKYGKAFLGAGLSLWFCLGLVGLASLY